MHRKSLLLISVILATIVLITCSDDSTTGPTGDNSIDSIAVSLSSPQAVPLNLIKLSGLPADNDSLYAVVMSAVKQGDSVFTPVMRTDSGDFLITPLNPDNPVAGGDIQVVITDNATVVTDPIDLSVEPLPAAPGEFTAIVSLQKEILGHKLRLSGITRTDFETSNLSQLAISDLPLLVAYDALESPDNPNSLSAMITGSAPMLGGNEPNWDLVDRLIARTGLRTYLQTYADALDTTEASQLVGRGRLTLGGARLMATSSRACIPAPDFGISDCKQLAAAMQFQYGLEQQARSAAEQLINDATGLAVTALGLIPGFQTEAAAIGGSLWIEAKLAEGLNNMFPSEFVDEATSFDPSVLQFPEDFTEPGKWTKFLVTARSKGWKLDKVVLEGIMQALSAKGAWDAIDDVPTGAINDIDGAMQDAFVGGGTDFVINEFADGSGILQVCPNSWNNINCVDKDYSKAVVSSGPLTVDEDQRSYQPTDLGKSILRLETERKFGSDNHTGEAAQIQTDPIEVHLNPYQVEADTNETIDFTVRVENAINEDVVYSLDGPGTLDTNGQLASVTTPVTPWDPPIRLMARSIANTGLRENLVAADPRQDEAPISYRGEGEVLVSPGFICLHPDHTEQFDVSYTGGDIDSVRWVINPAGNGDLEAVGNSVLYTAPETQVGMVQILAIVNGADTGFADVDVAACACYWDFTASGDRSIHYTGEFSSASYLGDALFVQSKTRAGENDPPLLSITFEQFSGIGHYDDLIVIYTAPGYHAWLSDDPEAPMPTADVIEYVPDDYLRMVVTGELQFRTNAGHPPEWDRIQFTLHVRAELTPGVHNRICSGTD